MFLTVYLLICLVQLPTDEEKAEEREESGWKLVHADVFRPPQDYPMLFCVLAGTGMQVCTVVYDMLYCIYCILYTVLFMLYYTVTTMHTLCQHSFL